jgi:hypothetical protein
MSKRSHITHFFCLAALAAATLLTTGSLTEVRAQRDPFQKPGYMKKPGNGPAAPGTPKTGPATPAKPVDFGPPAIEARIEYYKRLRETAAANGAPLPKVTSVLTLNEMAVTGIFKTPRGYAAMVEATPIKLSYTIYPGEKFFDGQLVAVEENRLVFRKVTKVGQGKFVASVENKALRQYSTKAQLEGTAPSQPAERPAETASNPVPPQETPAENPPAATKAKAKGKTKDTAPKTDPFASPLDELDKQSGEPAKADTNAKKPVKVARTKH